MAGPRRAAATAAEKVAALLAPPEEAPVVWQIERCPAGKGVAEDEAREALLLAAGWIPFGVTTGEGGAGYVYHYKRPASG